jgi:AcrR family transcriptional regulator
MSDPVKRPYTSSLRATQAQTTRRAIVDAASRLFVENGYGATTVDAIAAAAGVSRKTVFTSVGGKAEALKLAFDWGVVGDDAPAPLMERSHVKDSYAEPDARVILARQARFVRGVAERIAPLAAVARAAAGLDAEIRVLVESAERQRQQGMTQLARLLETRGALRPGLDVAEAADILWLLSDPGTYQRLVTRRGWPVERYDAWLAETHIALLVDPGYSL